MDQKKLTEYIIQKYQEDEQIMIQLFVQWCQNNELDPIKLYKIAYPTQPANDALKAVIDNNEPLLDIDIDTGTLIEILQLFGNDDLAYAVSEEGNKLSK